VTPRKLQFGDVSPGGQKTKHFKIANTLRNTTLLGTVGNPTGAGAAQFTIVSGTTNFSLPRGGRGDTITVRYMPSAAGATDTAMIVITSSDPNHPSVTVNLIGKGKKK
jgi:hypothetical protein